MNVISSCRAATNVVEEVQLDPPQPQEIRIKVVSTSLCRSDISAWESQNLFPRIFGHEASGTVTPLIPKNINFQLSNLPLTKTIPFPQL